jgi:Domain of unknown function (DUF1707)
VAARAGRSYGWPMGPDRLRPGVRLTDAERENAAAQVHVAHGEGRISLDELDRRLAVVYGARVAGDLVAALDDLPTDRERALPDRRAEPAVTLAAGPYGCVRHGRWTVPRRLVVDQIGRGTSLTFRGPVVLDLRTAVVTHPQVDVELRIVAIAQLILPVGSSADLRGLRGAGGLSRTEVPSRSAAGTIHVVVHGVVPRRRMVWVGYRPASRWWRMRAA